MATTPSKKDAKRLIESRDKNLRQLLLRTTRTLNALIEEELKRRGYDKVRVAHSVLLANLDLEGNSITTVAERSHSTKQAISVLAEELEALGYLTREVDEEDARARILLLTERGRKLMVDTFSIISDIEAHYTNILGEQTMDGLRTGLAAFMGVRQLT